MLTFRDMPSPERDALNALFHARPSLAVDLLNDVFDIELSSDTLVEVTPAGESGPLPLAWGEPEHGVIVELQRTVSEEDRQGWARRSAALWLRLKRPVLVLVLAPDAWICDWAAQPVVTSLPGYVLHPLVVGPEQVAPIADPAQAAECLELTVLSVLAHGSEEGVVETFLAALSKTEESRGTRYYEYAYRLASTGVRRALEEIMSSDAWPVHSPFAREHFSRGRLAGLCEGKARAVLAVLRARGVSVSDDALTTITSCVDQEQLDRWAHRAATALTVDELFA